MSIHAHGNDQRPKAWRVWSKSGMTQTRLAQKSRVRLSWVNMLLTGERGHWRRPATVKAMTRIAKVLGRSYDNLWN